MKRLFLQIATVVALSVCVVQGSEQMLEDPSCRRIIREKLCKMLWPKMVGTCLRHNDELRYDPSTNTASFPEEGNKHKFFDKNWAF